MADAVGNVTVALPHVGAALALLRPEEGPKRKVAARRRHRSQAEPSGGDTRVIGPGTCRLGTESSGRREAVPVGRNGRARALQSLGSSRKSGRGCAPPWELPSG